MTHQQRVSHSGSRVIQCAVGERRQSPSSLAFYAGGGSEHMLY